MQAEKVCVATDKVPSARLPKRNTMQLSPTLDWWTIGVAHAADEAYMVPVDQIASAAEGFSFSRRGFL
jgi:hypothetical protein